MKLKGNLAEVMEMIAPETHTPHMTTEKGVKVLCVQLLNALHGTLKAALLFCKKLVKWLKNLGFELNPHDICVANKTANKKQMTAVWHVDDLQMSHENPQEVTIFINQLKDEFEDENGTMTVTRGKKHNYP